MTGNLVSEHLVIGSGINGFLGVFDGKKGNEKYVLHFCLHSDESDAAKEVNCWGTSFFVVC
jgi:hypothetical protein